MNHDFYRAFFCRLFSIVAALGTGMASLRLYSHFLSPETYGVILVALQTLSYLPLLDGGFRTTTNRQLLSGMDDAAAARLIHFSQSLYSWLSLIATGIGILAMAIYAQTPIARSGGAPAGFFVAIGLVGALGFVNGAQGSMLIGLHAQASSYVLNGLNSLAAFTVLWGALHYGAGVWAFPLSMFAGTCVTYPLTLRLIKKIQPQVHFFGFRTGVVFWEQFRALKHDAWACFRSQFSIMLLFTIDVVLVGFLCGPAAAAVYGVLARIFGMVRNLLQVTGEVAWPLLARSRGAERNFLQSIFRINSWAYGAVMGAASVTLVPFLRQFMGDRWTAPVAVLYLVLGRFLITGVSSPASYALIGLGEFKALARYVERELVASVILALVVGHFLGLNGIALSFAVATCFGTLVPILWRYARIEKLSILRLFLEIWLRAACAFAVSCFIAQSIAGLIRTGAQAMVVGAVAAGASVVLALLVGGYRMHAARRGKTMDWANLARYL